ncbi:MAG TPA: Asp23/Gls24 family envelope stress response protein [Clostridia bacterium]|nr:Asp23/Gls24 family envelope stress response protein [Clostridia bacterium]
MDELLNKEKLPDDVIAICAMNAVLKTEGVFDLASGFTESLSKNILGRDTLTKGIKVSQEKDGIIIDVHVNVKYNTKIPNVAWEIQENVKSNVEDLTNLPILQVNIHIQGVGFEETESQKGTL